MRRRARPATLVVTARRAAKIQCLHSYVTDAKKNIGSSAPVKVSLPLTLLTFAVGPRRAGWRYRHRQRRRLCVHRHGSLRRTGQVRYRQAGGETVIEANTNSNRHN